MEDQTKNTESVILSSIDFVKIDEAVNKWIEGFADGHFTSESIQDIWRSWFPKAADCVQKNWENSKFEIREMANVSTALLQKFIFNGYPSDYAKELSKHEESRICTKFISASNDNFYKCLECESSWAPRVLCAECFVESEHRHHKYYILQGRNFYCCCGEDETWDKPWHCAKHPVRLHQSEETNLDLESRVRIVIEAILKQADNLLSDYEMIVKTLDGNDEMFCAILYTNLPFLPVQLQELLKNVMSFSNTEYLQLYETLCKEGKITINLPRTLCKVLKAANERQPNSPFRTLVVHVNDWVEQEFAFEMLVYLQECLKYGRNFRKIFTETVTRPFPSSFLSVAEKILVSLKPLPIHIRDCCKELLIFGTLTQYNTKETLAKMFIERLDVMMSPFNEYESKQWNLLWKFAEQLFTIPNLAYDLIVKQDALSRFTQFYLDEHLLKYNERKNIEEWEYEQNISIRLQLLSCLIFFLLFEVPKTWTETLRCNFLSALSRFLDILKNFHYVDSETRAIHEHVEYERNNLPALSVHQQLAACSASFLKWCRSDNEIQNIVHYIFMRVFPENIGEVNESEKIVELLNYSALCLPYDAQTVPVSICIPLYRFLVGFHLIEIENSQETLSTTLVSTIFHSVVNIQVMCAQFTAGMWNRNGTPAAERVETYRNSFRRDQIYDRDIQLLQIVAATTDANKFVINLLEKYGLINWANENFEADLRNVTNDEMNDITVISEQFLQLLITVLVERNVSVVSNVTEKECLKHEIIHRLCIKPTTIRSELKAYFIDIDFTVELNEVAMFKKPTSVTGCGTYQLREEFLDRYNALFYHYTPLEMSEANEFQRQRRKAAKESDCFPPPTLPKLKEYFAQLVGIFQCDITFHIMQTVLQRASDIKSRSYSDIQLQNVLYLIGHALQEQKSGNYESFSFTKKAERWKLLDCLEKVSTISRSGLPKDLLKWTINKYKEVIGLSTDVINEGSAIEDNEKVRKSKLAASRRAELMLQMTKMQNQFLKNNSTVDQKETVSGPDLASNIKITSESLDQSCILCQETQTLNEENEVLVTAAYVQYSTVLYIDRENQYELNDSPVLTANRGPAVYTSSCGHIMHWSCFKIYLHELWERESLQTNFPSGFDINRLEFICPLCECIGNTVLPLIAPSQLSRKNQSEFSEDLTITILIFADKLQTSICKSPLLVWKSLAYTIHVIETLLRDSNKPLLGHLSSRHYACLESFVRISQVASVIYPNNKSHESIIEELYLMLKGESKGLSTHLGYDIFNVWVIINLSESTPSPSLLHVVFLAQIVKILVTTNFNETIDDVNYEEGTPFKQILQLLGDKRSHLSENFIWTYVQKACLPFLRCCAIFHSFANGSPQPVQLTEVGGDSFSNMCSYLGLPQTRAELFDNRDVYLIVQIWLKNPQVSLRLQDCSAEFPSMDPLYINQLTKLPHEYCDLINMASTWMCFNHRSIQNPMVCLVCGTFVCGDTLCLKLIEGKFMSPLDLHSAQCHEELYLKVKTNEIVMRSQGNLTVVFRGPYLDEYFDNDPSLITDSPLYLCAEKYKHVHNIWLSHGLIEKISILNRSSRG